MITYELNYTSDKVMDIIKNDLLFLIDKNNEEDNIVINIQACTVLSLHNVRTDIEDFLNRCLTISQLGLVKVNLSLTPIIYL